MLTMKKTLLILFLVSYFLAQSALFPVSIFAQSVTSAPFITKVGSPTGPPPGGTGSNITSNNSVAQAGLDLAYAYRDCPTPKGAWFTTESIDAKRNLIKRPCLEGQLTSKYSTTLPSFVGRYGNGLGLGAIIAHGDGTYCAECMGYVALSISLATNSSNALFQSNPRAVSVTDVFVAGDVSFVSIGSGLGTDIQPGDIGVTANGSAGHIVIVSEVSPVQGGSTFKVLESNRNFDCKITINEAHNKQGYKFYRRKN